ncbi:hypothetical protein GQ53DRAFT_763904 [Thozetella sp. PMI_491]|nr:hypothetical protein GQ53DRAFT_763904 [Thozetella sp. PMI_491]
MPRTRRQEGPELAIELVNWQSYAPGDVIIGKVIRSQHLVSADARVTIRLYGRAKSKMTVKRQHGSSVYRGRFNFFNPEDTYFTIFSGPIHIPPSGEPQSWSFAMTIPTKIHAATIAADNNNKDHSYFSLEKENVEKQPLPDTFFYQGSDFLTSTKFHGFVEYYLEAQLVMKVNGKENIIMATLPLFIRTPGTKVPIGGKEFAYKPYHDSFTAKSKLLVPGAEPEKPTFKQKAQGVFSRGKIPKLDFLVQAAYPSKIQLGTPIPFPVRVVVDHEKTAEVLQNVPFMYKLVSINLILRSTTTVLCQGTLGSHDKRGEAEYNFGLDDFVSRVKHEIFLPEGGESESLDLGTMFQILLEETHASALGRYHGAGSQRKPD